MYSFRISHAEAGDTDDSYTRITGDRLRNPDVLTEVCLVSRPSLKADNVIEDHEIDFTTCGLILAKGPHIIKSDKVFEGSFTITVSFSSLQKTRSG